MTPVQPTGRPPVIGNLYVMFWPLLNIIIVVAIVAVIFWYLKKRNDDRKQLLNKLDIIIMYLHDKKND